jgi:LysM repeat protein/GH25 family lysozyme M1 (1,4-beta-N-acetylmuramidase)
MTLFGPDLSSAQAGIDAGALPGDFVVIKATGGKSYVNPYCDTWYQQAKRKGKRRAVYHFVHDPGHQGTADEEARWFLKNTQGYLGDAIFIMDWEGDNVTDTVYAMEFKRIVETEGRVRLMVYGSTSKLEYVRPLYNANSPLWAAGYSLGYQPINGYQPPAGGPLGVPAGLEISMWQFTSTDHLPGWPGDLDVNVFYGDGTAWDKLAARLPGGAAPAPAPAPVAAPRPAPAPAPRPAPARPAVSQCRVTAGDTLTSIAAQFGTTVAAMIAANPGINPNVIRVDQILNLPGHAAAPAPRQCRVTAGDTLTSIAQQFGTTVQHLIQVNPGINPNVIRIDQILNL